jgi:hypothetical protein
MNDKPDEAAVAWVDAELAAMNAPCAVCRMAYAQHSLELMRTCFLAMPDALRAARQEGWEQGRDAAVEALAALECDVNYSGYWKLGFFKAQEQGEAAIRSLTYSENPK